MRCSVCRTVAIYGGSFDPPHQGHAAVLAWLCTQEGLAIDEVWVLPTVAHAFHKALAPYEARVQMLQAILEDLRPCRYRIVKIVRRDEPFMVDTLEALHGEEMPTRFLLVLGSDIIPEAPTRWARWERVLELAAPLWISRAGYPLPEGYTMVPFGGCAHPADTPHVFEIGAPAGSSTSIRTDLARLTTHRPHLQNLSAKVLQIVYQQEMYRR